MTCGSCKLSRQTKLLHQNFRQMLMIKDNSISFGIHINQWLIFKINQSAFLNALF